MRWTAKMFALLMVLFMGCTTESTSVNVRCKIEVDPIEEINARGTTLTIYAHPLTDVFDTHIQINQTVVHASSIDKEMCSECNTCRTDYGCTDCAYCPTCEETCNACQHSLTLTIPEALPMANEYWFTLYNSLGSSEAVYLSIQEN